MKKYIIIILSFLPLLASGQAIQGLISKADSAYIAGDYSLALKTYLSALDKNGSSSNLYYNIANSYYRTGNLPKAILFYERSLRLDPTNSNAKENLEYLNSKIIDRPGEYYSGLESLSRGTTLCFSSDTWAIIAAIAFCLAIICSILYFFIDSIALRKIGFFGGITMIVMFVFCVIESFCAKNISESRDEAIIIAKSVILSTSPRKADNQSEEAMLLHEGTKLHIQDSIKVDNDSISTIWYDVMTDREHRAWISSQYIEKIK